MHWNVSDKTRALSVCLSFRLVCVCLLSDSAGFAGQPLECIFCLCVFSGVLCVKNQPRTHCRASRVTHLNAEVNPLQSRSVWICKTGVTPHMHWLKAVYDQSNIRDQRHITNHFSKILLSAAALCFVQFYKLSSLKIVLGNEFTC